MPIRQDFWDIPQPWGPIVIYSVMSITTIIMLWLWFRRINLLRYGVPVKWKDRLGLRFNNFLRDGLFQIGILRKRYRVSCICSYHCQSLYYSWGRLH